MAILRKIFEPRTMLIVFGAIGVLGIVVVLISAAQPVAKPWDEAAKPLLVGEMSDFEPTFPARRVPELLVQTDGGEAAYLPDLVGNGDVTLVNLWASWCAPCLEELPSLVALSERTGAVLVPVAQERRSDAQDRVLAKAGVAGRVPVLTDPDLALSRVLGGRDVKLPVTIVYDRRGREVGRLVGAADWASPEAVRLIEAVQDGTAAL